MKMPDLKPLELLDLKKCDTVSDIVTAMGKCSFGARMLGEATQTIRDWIKSGKNPAVIFDGKAESPVGKLLQEMVKNGWITRSITSQVYASEAKSPEKNVLVVGLYPELYEDAIYKKPERAIFINSANLCKPGQVMDGYFPDAVFADHKYVIPVLYYALLEELKGQKTKTTHLIKELAKYGGVAEQVADGAETVRAMIQDKDCYVFLTLSGAMTIAKMGLVICDMIDNGYVQCIASTGALMAHGLVESVGLKHYKHNPKYDDKFLTDNLMNRVTDTLEPEDNLNHIQQVLDQIFDDIDAREPVSPTDIHRMIGKYLKEKFPNDRAILKSAYEKNIPIIVPAFVDSEIGNDLNAHNYRRQMNGKQRIMVDMEKDTRLLVDITQKADKTGIFTIGGGVPRNYIQNVAPQIELLNNRVGMNLKMNRFKYGTKICPDQMQLGHLSGCTYSEGMTWRKMDVNGRFTTIQSDATIVWPFIVKYVMEN